MSDKIGKVCYTRLANVGLGILMNGTLVTVGSLYELQTKYGEYTISVTHSRSGLPRREIVQLIKSALKLSDMGSHTVEKEVITVRVE